MVLDSSEHTDEPGLSVVLNESRIIIGVGGVDVDVCRVKQTMEFGGKEPTGQWYAPGRSNTANNVLPQAQHFY